MGRFRKSKSIECNNNEVNNNNNATECIGDQDLSKPAENQSLNKIYDHLPIPLKVQRQVGELCNDVQTFTKRVLFVPNASALHLNLENDGVA